jgi:hypothetical protein
MSNINSFIENLPKCTSNKNNLSPSCDNNKFLDINCPEMTKEELNNFCFQDTSCRVICPKDITLMKNTIPDVNNSTSLESFKNYLDKSAKNILGKSLVEKLTGTTPVIVSTFPSNSDYSESPPSQSSDSSPSSSSSSLSSLCYMGLGVLIYMAFFKECPPQNPQQAEQSKQALINTDSSAPISSDKTE